VRGGDRLFSRAALVTPNLDEARMYLGTTIDTLEGMQIAAREFARFGSKAVLLKGGHLADRAADVLWSEGTIAIFDDVRLPYELRGTGDLLSAAITVALGSGATIHDAVVWARGIVRAKITGGVAFAGMRVAE
jgi:hydroxymethylpyrimidine/phosphomethylpyrimidine kinase